MRDPLDRLRRAYAAVTPPEPADELARCEPEVRRAVERLRAAWAAVEPPAPIAAPRARRPAPRRIARLAWLAAAAALLALAALAALRLRAIEPAPSVAEAEPSEPAPSVAEAEPEPAPTLASVAPDRVEITSGNVRLVLLAAAPPEQSHATEDPRNPR